MAERVLKDSRFRGWLVTLLVAAAAVWHTTRYWGFFSDDAMISLRYAKRLVAGDGLTWTDGEFVEGYSNLLWVLMTAAMGLVGLDLVFAARLLGVASLVGLVFAASYSEKEGRLAVKRALSGGALIAVTGGFAVWAVAGLSQTFASFLGVLALLLTRRLGGDDRTVAVLAMVFGMLCLNRIDGFVLVGVVVAAALASRVPPRPLVTASLGAVSAVLLQQAFRLAYYQDWVPNTARVKVSFTLQRAYRGADWVMDGLLAHPLLVVLAVVTLWIGRGRDAVLAAILWTGFCAYVGGDIFFGYRLLLPALALLCLAAADLGEELERRPFALLCMLLPLHAWLNLSSPAMGTPAKEGKHWVFRTEGPAEVLRRSFHEADPLLAVDAAGALPFYTEFRSVDMLGLTDRYLATHPPKSWGKGGLGHDLGDGAYIWGRKPDIIAFASGLGGKPNFLSGRQLVRRPDWESHYRQVTVKGEGVKGQYFFRVRDSVVGMRAEDSGWFMPGWFFSKWSRPSVLRGGVLAPVFAKGEHGLQMDVPPGIWQVSVVANHPVEVASEVVRHPGGNLVVGVRFEKGKTRLHGIRFSPAPDPGKVAESLGVVSRAENAQPGLNLVTSGDGPVVRLLDGGGAEVHAWTADYQRAFPGGGVRRLSPAAGRIRRAHLLPDGGLLAVFEGHAIVKLDRDSKPIWGRENNAHHDIDVQSDGSIWTLGRSTRHSVSYGRSVVADSAVHLSADGDEIRKLSILDAVKDSRFGAQLKAKASEGGSKGDILHTNAIRVLDLGGAGPFRDGNLLLSSRALSLVFILDGESGELVWGVQGDFQAQHDPHLLADGSILLFDNGAKQSRLVRVDAEGELIWEWSRPGFFSHYYGAVQPLPNGGFLATESARGRAIELDANGEVVWEFHSPWAAAGDPWKTAPLFEVERLSAESVSGWLE